ncbi:pyrroline-5-carboxylate reductase [Leucobacter exalbidus]|nr:pyrroline-5-carboxylate reductase [Leucobacter exalbidus]
MIGVGSMGGAILSGLTAPGIRIALPITVTTQSAVSAQARAVDGSVIALAAETDPAANRAAVRGAGLVILGVKPWLIHDVVRDIAGDLAPGTVLVSVAAGVTSASIEALLPAGIAVVRAMPNTPSHLGLGMTGIAGGATASAADIALAHALFSTVGEVLEVTESQINDIAAVSGSGPAYLFLYAEHMIDAAVRRGFTEDQARLLVQQTLLGSATLLARSDDAPAQLRRNVTSPKGTTERAIEVLQGDDWGPLFDRALAANVQRSEELEGA